MLRKNKWRFVLSLGLFTVYAFFITLAASTMNWDGPFYLMLTWFISTPIAAYLMGLLWRYDLVPRDLLESQEDKAEKRKRQAIDDVLRDLSNDDLLRLQRRLQDGMIDDELLYEQLGDDGEWTRKQRDR